MVISDNLAAHVLGGFMCCFGSGKRFCRFCTCVRCQINDIGSIDLLTLRSKDDYDAQVRAVEIDSSLSSVYGIKHGSVLNKLNYYHVTSGLPPDLAHDLFEGFAVDFVTQILICCVRANYLTLDDFNDKLASFSYCEVDKKNKPQPVKVKSLTTLKVKQTACEMWNLIRLLPLLIAETIPKNEPIWLAYLSFLDVVERLCANEFSHADLIVLQSLIDDFLVTYLTVFPENRLKPKAHYLRHYLK